jgi:hypothetical protein
VTIGRQDFQRGNDIKMRPLRWALIKSDLCPCKKRKFEHKEDTRNTHKEERPSEDTV